MTDSNSIPGIRIRELRTDQGITQRELSDRIGVTENTIANWEKGRSIGQWLQRIRDLCNVLGCTFEELMDNSYIENASSSEGTFSDIASEFQKNRKTQKGKPPT